ncbi:metallophosphoesterase family protein [Spirilliplanes yamanashiensis]|uniref:metallophosphoesterase family protein n=1 Tax=Spirilliplanes yamanashiensis TaxID=42233 RepID=UPI001EF1EEA5|nr:metallophosphoesterase [Spirilliplanes yamanashiensis]
MRLPAVAVLLLGLAACTGDTPPAPAGATPARSAAAAPAAAVESAGPAPAVLVGAGDIATCDGTGDSRTADLVARIPGTVFTLGDNAYDRGSAAEFRRCYGPTWGRFKGRTRPVVGNHEYGTPGAAGHFGYFGAAAGPRPQGYYAYRAGSWLVVVLNNNCGVVPGGCGAGSPQERWLRARLAADRGACTVALMHEPRFTSSTVHPPSTASTALVKALYDDGVELMLAGHNHGYERFAPQTATGRRDDARGIRQIMVGTGGARLYPFGKAAPNSEVRDAKHWGVLKLTLGAGTYRWDFVPVAGSFRDSGTGRCR